MSVGSKVLWALVRIAIGWHFLYEGLWKLDSDTGQTSWQSSWYPLRSATAALRDRYERGDAAPDPAWADDWYERVVKGVVARGRALSAEGVARLAALRDEVKRAAAAAAGGEIPRDEIVGFDWFDVREDVLGLAPDPAPARFSARPFLRSSAGPLRPFFRGLLGDIDGIERLKPAAVQAALDRRCAEILGHYERAKVPFTAEQRQRLAMHRDALKAAVAPTFASPSVASRLRRHEEMLARVARSHAEGTPFEAERLEADRRKLDALGEELLALAHEPLQELSARAESIATAAQLAAGPLPRLREPGDWIDFVVRWSLIVIGLCLLLGVMTPVAATAAALHLAAFYLASPPWPDLPAAMADGHHLYVDRNLIELLAVLAAAGSGRWLGLDVLLTRWWRHRRARPAADRPPLQPAERPAEDPACS